MKIKLKFALKSHPKICQTFAQFEVQQAQDSVINTFLKEE